jgi:hypothetical protein
VARAIENDESSELSLALAPVGLQTAFLNAPADFWGFKTNKMFILTQAGNHDALHYGNLVTYLRLMASSCQGAGFDGPATAHAVASAASAASFKHALRHLDA